MCPVDDDPIATPSSLEFGFVPVGQELTKSFAIQNQGSGPLNLGDAGIDPSAFALAGDFQTFVEPGQSVTVDVQFRPGAAVETRGTLTIQTDSTVKPILEVQLDGTGF
ncbi:MAG TPA: choice-of-anchor D domain-containing protein [Myxococcales bacterium]|nr:choice-of-anchor D domain-containing protein [Myxococcales bacterium]